MLIQFKFKNHKCFYDESILDLSATLEKRHMESLIDINGNSLLPIISIHGSNASGKSSLLESLNFMFSFIKNQNKIDINNDINVFPYLFNDMIENSEYEVSVVLKNYEYRYGFSINKDRIEDEWLYTKKFSFNSRCNDKLIFERNNNNFIFGKQYSKYKNMWDLFSNNINVDKLLILSNLAFKEKEGILRDIIDYINKFDFKIESEFKKNSIDILSNNDIIFDRFQKFINVFDPCLLGIDIKKIDTNDDLYIISGIHKGVNDDVLIPLKNESNGTIRLFNILPTILKNLNDGGLLCIDELDIKLHPLLFRKIVNMYMDKNININNSQLIFTSHSTFLFNSDTLRRDQIYIVDKDISGKSSLYSLSEFKNLRVDADYEKKYLTGQFGGIPFNN